MKKKFLISTAVAVLSALLCVGLVACKSDPNDSAEKTLKLGENTISTNTKGVDYTFYSKAGGTYKITWEDSYAAISVKEGEETSAIASSYSFSVAERGAAVFHCATTEGKHEYKVTLSDEAEGERKLELGENTVSAKYEGVEYVFYSKVGGTYTASWEDEKANVGYLQDGAFHSLGDSPYTFTLGERESFVFVCSTDESGTVQYTVKIETVEVENTLQVGDNDISTDREGANYTFFSKTGGIYTIAWTEANAFIGIDKGYGVGSGITSPYTFKLQERGAITFFCGTNGDDDTYTVTIESVGEEGKTLYEGENTVSADYEGVNYTFYSKAGGTYTISWSHDNAFIGIDEGAGVGDGLTTPHTFTLQARGMITIFCGAQENDGKEVTFTVTITKVEAEVDVSGYEEITLGTQVIVSGIDTTDFNAHKMYKITLTAGSYKITTNAGDGTILFGNEFAEGYDDGESYLVDLSNYNDLEAGTYYIWVYADCTFTIENA